MLMMEMMEDLRGCKEIVEDFVSKTIATCEQRSTD